MFSLDNFYQIISQNLFLSFDRFVANAFKNFGSQDFNDLETVYGNFPYKNMNVNEFDTFNQVLFHDQEPFYQQNFINHVVMNDSKIGASDFLFNRGYEPKYFSSNFHVFANSEHSQEKTNFCNEFNFYGNHICL